MSENSKSTRNSIHRMSRNLIKKWIYLLPYNLINSLRKKSGIYPYTTGREIQSVKRVLAGWNWNMTSGDQNSPHISLEAAACRYTGASYAIAVGSGGAGIQMVLRALGNQSGSEVLHQVDTCAASPLAILGAHFTPRFVDSDLTSFHLDVDQTRNLISKNSKVILATHMWGNIENMTEILDLASERDLQVVEDCCLSLGATLNGNHVGNQGIAGIFSFGSSKPVQAGEGGFITTNDPNFARELRSIRQWGDRTFDFNESDVTQFGINGRMSEITAAIALEQLQNYPERLKRIQDEALQFSNFINKIEGFEILESAKCNDIKPAFSQFVVKLGPKYSKKKQLLRERLTHQGIGTFHANFQPVNSLTFFKSGDWLEWTHGKNEMENKKQEPRTYPNADYIYSDLGIGFVRYHFESTRNRKFLEQALLLAIRNL